MARAHGVWIQSYLDQYITSTKCTIRYCLRHLAEFSGYKRDEWSKATQDLFTIGQARGMETLDAFYGWALKRHNNSIPSAKRARGSIITLLRHAHADGVSSWHVPNALDAKTAANWKRCPKELRFLVHDWLRVLAARRVASNSIKGYKTSVLRYGHFLRGHSLSPLQVSERHILAWSAEMTQAGLQPTTINVTLRNIRGFYKWLHKTKRIESYPFEDLRIPSPPKRAPRAASEEQVVILIEATTTPIEGAFMEFLYSTGCRISELCRGNISDLSLGQSTITCQGKGNKERVLHLTEPAKASLLAYFPERTKILAQTGNHRENALFVNQEGRRLTVGRADILFRNVRKRSGLPSSITPHVIRHSFASHLLAHGARFGTVQRLLGHQNSQSTAGYISIVPRYVAKIYRKACPTL